MGERGLYFFLVDLWSFHTLTDVAWDKIIYGVEVVRGEATDAASAREGSRGAAVVYHAINVLYPHW